MKKIHFFQSFDEWKRVYPLETFIFETAVKEIFIFIPLETGVIHTRSRLWVYLKSKKWFITSIDDP